MTVKDLFALLLKIDDTATLQLVDESGNAYNLESVTWDMTMETVTLA